MRSLLIRIDIRNGDGYRGFITWVEKKVCHLITNYIDS